MKKIILPVDFSDSSNQLVDYAIGFAKEINAEILLIHVAAADIGFVIGDMGFQYFPEVEENEMKYELKELHKLQEKVLANGVQCSHILKQGIPGDTILEYAAENSADYIVIGSHGRSGFYDVFIGSLTKEITKKSKIPVLVVPCHDEN
ncbi:universal stress protein [Chryseobacterium sp. SC28]|uniref:universal stress protein n=1 Tax=Chryseobacterium sp. SC28 TaxID=2268028 RepID=UPI000F64B0CF|nr:universal stress protein [Chryseobacterium sp. SC28]RRQ45393.1 universal stress protein [Chryseobacterium sp. SC28]